VNAAIGKVRCISTIVSRSTFQPPGHDLRFGVGIHETTFRVNVRWVTPLGEETASTW
jgi:hypothetical protein